MRLVLTLTQDMLLFAAWKLHTIDQRDQEACRKSCKAEDVCLPAKQKARSCVGFDCVTFSCL